MKKIFLLLLPFLFIFSVWFAFASPYFLHGKVPYSSAYQVSFFPPWAQYPSFWQPVKNNAMPDVITQIYPWKHLVIQQWQQGIIPLWNPYSFGGTPLLANYQSGVLTPFNLLFFILPFVDGWSLLVLLQPLLAGIGTYLFARQINISKKGSVLSAISFMFCGFIVCWMGYATLGYAILFLPYALFFLDRFFQKNNIWYLVAFALTLPLSFFSGHFQISIYFLIGVLTYNLFLIFSTGMYRKGIYTFLFLISGIFLTLPQVLPSLEFYTQSLRSGLVMRTEVIPWAYLPTLLAPDFFGNAVTRNDWFGHYAEWNGYVGVITLLLSFLSIQKIKNKKVLFLWLFGIIALLFAYPTPLGEALVFLKIPVLATSAASRIIVLFSFSFALLGGVGLDVIGGIIQKKEWKHFLKWIGVAFIFFGILWAVIIFKFFIPLDKIAIAKSNLLLPTVLCALLFSFCALAFVVPKKFTKLLLVGILLLLCFDMYRFASKWQPFDGKNLVFPHVPVVNEFQKITGYKRVLGNYGAEVSVYYNLAGVEGYDALYPKRFGEFIASLETGKLTEAQRSVVSFPRTGKNTISALNLLNISYIVHKKSDDNKLWTFPFWLYPQSQFSLVYEDDAYKVLRNNTVFPRAFFTTDYRVATKNQSILDALFAGGIDLSKTVVVENKPNFQNSSQGIGKVTITSYTASQVNMLVDASQKGFVFLSDQYYPGWVAYLDGKQAPILRADYTFRAVEVPPGKHTLVYMYQPQSFLIGVIVFGVGILGILLAVGYWIISKTAVGKV